MESAHPLKLHIEEETIVKVTVITGSPHKAGTSALLADEFSRGAQEAGHTVHRFDAAFADMGPCRACGVCGMGSSPCVQKDDMAELMPELLQADVVALVTPLYYFGFSAQIKRVIDRFYAKSPALTGGKKAILLATAHDDAPQGMEALVAHYHAITQYMEWAEGGMVLANGCGARSDIENTDFPKQAYALGRGL